MVQSGANCKNEYICVVKVGHFVPGDQFSAVRKSILRRKTAKFGLPYKVSKDGFAVEARYPTMSDELKT